MVGGGNDRIVERRAAASLDLFQPLFQLVDVGGEILVKVILVVEVDDAHFIVGIRRAHQIQGRRVHLLPLLAHGTGVIDHDAHGHGNVFVAERGDGLRAPILVHVEIALIEGGDDALLVVDDRGMQHDFFDLLAENEDAAVGGIRILSAVEGLRWRCRLGIRSGLGLVCSRRRWARGSALRSRVRQEQRRQEEENRQRNSIPSAHSNPSWHRP